MSELNQDVEKVAADVRAAEGQVDVATQRALGAVNRQTSWVERHPKMTLSAIVVLVVIAITLAIKAF